MREIQLDDIDFVLLDLDGTLLDKYFDDRFWLHLVPEKYAELNNMSIEAAKKYLFSTYKHHEGTLKWTDLDHWSTELNLDIPVLKEQLRHLIDIHPHAEAFLAEMRKRDKRIHLFTNAHFKSVKLKFKETGIGKYFDSVITSNEIGAPKEDQEYWHRAARETGLVKERSLFIDDTESILYAAREFGIKHVLFKGRSSSQEEPKASDEFLSITDFNELLED